MGLDKAKIIRMLRLALTCIFVFILTWYYEVPESAWALVTIWFVMYEYTTVGGVLTKSFLRFAGTALSALYGIIIVYCCGNNPVINMIALIPGLLVYGYYFMGGDKTYIGTIGAVTLTIVLLNYNNIDTAILRVFNVIIGIIGSMLMIRFFYPQYARNLIHEIQTDWIDRLGVLLTDYLSPEKTLEQLKIELLDYDKWLFTSMSLYERYVNEAKMETRNTPLFITHAIEAKKQFKLLSRLVSVLIAHLSVEATRVEPWVCDQLNAILKELQGLRHQLVKQEAVTHPVENKPEQQNIIEEDDDKAVERRVIENNESLNAIFKDMQTAITLLGEEVNNIVVLYELYAPTAKTA